MQVTEWFLNKWKYNFIDNSWYKKTKNEAQEVTGKIPVNYHMFIERNWQKVVFSTTCFIPL